MTTYKQIKEECVGSGIPREDGGCGLNHFVKCDGYKCPVLHFFRGTRPPRILDAEMQAKWDEEMGDGCG